MKAGIAKSTKINTFKYFDGKIPMDETHEKKAKKIKETPFLHLLNIIRKHNVKQQTNYPTWTNSIPCFNIALIMKRGLVTSSYKISLNLSV